MASRVTVEGLEDCLSFIEQSPSLCLKAVRAATRDASRDAVRTLRQDVPRRWRRLISSVVEKDRSGKIQAYVGGFNRHVKQGRQYGKQPVEDWFKAYWSNYGTLSKRDSSHQFKYPVRPDSYTAAKSRRNRVGQPAQGFFENAMPRSQQTFINAFEQHLYKQAKKYLKTDD